MLPGGSSGQNGIDYGSLSSTSTATYDDGGVTRTVTSSAQYDGWGRMIRTVNPNNAQVNTAYDAMGRVASKTTPFTAGGQPGASTAYQYDGLGRLKVTTLPDGNTVRSDYSGSSVTATDQVGRKIYKESDGLGRLVKVIEQNSSGGLTQETTYAYNLLNKLTQVNQGNQGQSTQYRYYKYDALGRLLYERIPEQSATISDGAGGMWSCKYTYTEFNSISTRQDARGVVTTYNYDAVHRVTGVSYNTSGASGVAETPSVTISYNTNGTLNQISVNATSTVQNSYLETYSYDQYNRAQSVTRWILGQTYDTRKTYTTSYEYNDGNQLTRMIYPSGQQVSFNRDEKGRMQSLTYNPGDVAGYLTNITYDIAGNVTGQTLGNGVAEGYGYDSQRLQLISQTATKGAATLMSLTYGYLSAAGQNGTGTTAGNTGKLITVGGTVNGTSESASYTYDLQGRLATSNQGSNGASAQRRFEYDRWGNRTSVWDAVTGGTQIQAVSLQQSGGAPTNRITSVTNQGGTLGYAYDAAGNVTNDGQHAYTYDAENRIVSVDAGAATYRYDHQNRRVAKIVGSSWTHYVWQGGQCIAEHDGTQTYSTTPTYSAASARVDYVYSGNRMIYRRQRSGSAAQWNTNYYMSDRLSIRLVTDASGNVTGRQAHLAFGEDFAESGAQQKQHFTGYERDGETGTDYAINRMYSQNAGRFNRADPVRDYAGNPQRLNRYSYVQNDPVNKLDPLGLFSQCVIVGTVLEQIDDGEGGIYDYKEIAVLACGDATANPRTGPGEVAGGTGCLGQQEPLTGDDLKKYNEERDKVRNKLKNSTKCRDFLTRHGIDPEAALDAVNLQRAYDGKRSNLSRLAAGFLDANTMDWGNPVLVQYALACVSVEFTNKGPRKIQAHTAFFVGGGLNPTFAGRSDVYYRSSGISASTILHEALHSLTAMEDPALASKLGVTVTPDDTEPISKALHDNDCGG